MATSGPSYTASQFADMPINELKVHAEDEFLEQLNAYIKQYEDEVKAWLESGGAEEQSWSSKVKETK